MGNRSAAKDGESSATGALEATFASQDDPLRTGALSEALTGLQEKYGATYDYRRDQKTGEAVLRLHLPNGDVVAGRGPGGDTATAFANLVKRVEALLAE